MNSDDCRAINNPAKKDIVRFSMWGGGLAMFFPTEKIDILHPAEITECGGEYRI